MALDQNVPLVSNQIAIDLIAMNANWEQLVADLAAKVSDAVYAAAWDGVVTIAPSKNAVYDKINTIDTALLNLLEAGTKMWFYQNTAPTGWTITAGIADVAIAVKGGSGSYNVNGGNIAGSWTQPDCTLTTANLPAHDHGAQTPVITISGESPSSPGIGNGHLVEISNGGFTGDCVLQLSASQEAHTHTSVGSGTAHSHGTAYRPYAAVGIICTKD